MGAQRLHGSNPEAASHVARHVYGHALLKLCCRGDQALVADHLLHSVQHEGGCVALLLAMLQAATGSMSLPCGVPGLGEAHPRGSHPEAAEAAFSEPGAKAAVRRLLLHVLDTAPRVVRT